MGFWGLGFHFQRKGGGFRREKRGKLFSFSSARGSSKGVAGWLCKGGGGPAGRTFPKRGQGGFQRGGLARGGGGLAGGERRQWRKNINKKIESDGSEQSVHPVRRLDHRYNGFNFGLTISGPIDRIGPEP